MCYSYAELSRKTQGVLHLDLPKGKICLAGNQKFSTGGNTKISVEICPIFRVSEKGVIKDIIKGVYPTYTNVNCPKVEFRVPYLVEIFGRKAQLEANIVCQHGKSFSGDARISGIAGVDTFSLKLSTEQTSVFKISTKRRIMGYRNIPCRFESSYNTMDKSFSNSLVLSPLSRLFLGAEIKTGCFPLAKLSKSPSPLSVRALIVYSHHPRLSYSVMYSTATQLSKPVISARMNLGKRFGSTIAKKLDSVESTAEIEFDSAVSSFVARAGLGVAISDVLSCRFVVDNHGILKGCVKNKGSLEITTGFEIDPRKSACGEAVAFGLRAVIHGSCVL